MKTYIDKIERMADDFSNMVSDIGLRLLLILAAVLEYHATYPITENAIVSSVISIGGIGAIHTTVSTWHITKYRYMIGFSVLHFILLGFYVQMRMDIFMIGLAAIAVIVATTYARAINEIRQTGEREEEDRERDQQIEDEDRAHQQRLQLIDAEAKAEAKRIKASVSPVSHGSVSPASQNGVSQSSDTAEERQSALLHMIQSHDTDEPINKSELARQLGVSRATINRDWKQLNGSIER